MVKKSKSRPRRRTRQPVLKTESVPDEDGDDDYDDDCRDPLCPRKCLHKNLFLPPGVNMTTTSISASLYPLRPTTSTVPSSITSTAATAFLAKLSASPLYIPPSRYTNLLVSYATKLRSMSLIPESPKPASPMVKLGYASRTMRIRKEVTEYISSLDDEICTIIILGAGEIQGRGDDPIYHDDV